MKRPVIILLCLFSLIAITVVIKLAISEGLFESTAKLKLEKIDPAKLREYENERVKCDNGESNACINYSHVRGRVYKDIEGAQKYAKRACELGDQEICQIIRRATTK